MKYISAILILIILTLRTLAEEIDDKNIEDKIDNADEKVVAQQEISVSNQNDVQDVDFQPDEEISEDFPVPIPYDI